MSVLIQDNGNLLYVTVSGEKHSLPKSSIELNVWDGHLIIWSFMRERYRFAYADVTTPSSAPFILQGKSITKLTASLVTNNNTSLEGEYDLILVAD